MKTYGYMPMMECPACNKDWQWDDYYDVQEGTERECPNCGADVVVEWAEPLLHVCIKVKPNAALTGERTEEK